MDILLSTLQALPTGIGSFLLLLGLLVFVHELGHFAAAKYYGVRVEVFSLGFGKKIFQFKRGDTTYCVSLIPLGGYVKMYGDDPSKEPPPEEKQFAFLHKPIWPRIAIVLAGPVMNLIFAIFLFFCLGIFGEKAPGTQLGDIDSGTAAYMAGFRSGDVVTAVNGETVKQWKDVKETIEVNADQELTFQVNRLSTPVEVKATPKLIDNPFIFSTMSKVGSVEGLSLDSKAAIVGVSNPQSPAAKAGFGPLELVESIGGEKISFARDLEPALQKAVTHLGGGKHSLAVTIEFEIRAMQDVRNADEIKTRKVTVQFQPQKKHAIAEEIGFLDTQTFLLSVKKGSPGLTLKSAVKDSPASVAGLRNGDQIVALNGKPTTKWDDVLNAVKGYDEKLNGINITYRRSGEERTVNVVPEFTEIPNQQGGLEKRFAIGVVPAILTVQNPFTVVKQGFLGSIAYGFSASWEYTKLIAMSLLRLVQAQVSPRNIGGVITIGRVASQSFEAGWDVFVKTMAVISINLFLLNLLPVPVLDGGHLVFFLIEAVRGAPLSLRKLEIAQQVGVLLLLSLMAFALFNDLTHWISSW